MVYIIMERKTFGDGDKPIHVFASERKCRIRLSEILQNTMQLYPNAVQTIINDGIDFTLDNDFISYQILTMEISK